MIALRIRTFLVTPVGVASLAVAAPAGCSASGGERADVAASVRALFQAVAHHDGRTACAVLAPVAGDSLATGDSTCEEEILKAGLTGGPIGHVQVWGDRAQARAGSDTVFLARFGGNGWKVTAAGCQPRRGRPYDCEIEA